LQRRSSWVVTLHRKNVQYRAAFLRIFNFSRAAVSIQEPRSGAKHEP
jgi:hypothetical protein